MDGDSEEEEEPRPRAGFFLHVLPALLYVGAVFYGGSIGMASLPETELISADKLMHALAFGGMQLVVLRAMRFELPRLRLALQNLLTLGCVSAIGALLELYQMALPHRSAELYDWVADTLGAGLVAIVVHWVARSARG
jgi:hypothetical protein